MAMEIARASIPQVARNLGELMAQGFTISPPLLFETELSPLRQVVDGMQLNSKTRGGVRNLLRSSRVLARAVEAGPIAEFARSLAGAGARATKLTLFNKSRQANWTIRWHQDAMIAVAERREAPGFRGWSEKEGVMHVRPPAHVLESIVALRVHLGSARK